MHLSVLIVLPLLTNALDLCSLYKSNLTEYRYKSAKWKNCNCIQEKRCIRKCCAVGFLATKGICQKSNTTYFKVPLYKKQEYVRDLYLNDTGLLVGVMDCDFYALLPQSNTLDRFFVQENADIFSLDLGIVGNRFYCVDELKDNGFAAFVCYKEDSTVISERINVLGMIISIPFLLATFIAYALLPDRNLHMKALMSYVINLLIGYILLVTIQMSTTKFSNFACLLLGYFCLFFFMVSFFWMNVICIDIWFAFSGLRGFSGSKRAEKKRFFLYCAYAWGMSIVHAFIVFLLNTYTSKKSWYYPGIGDSQCFLQRGYSELFYFYGPMGILITINIILFIVTAFKIRKVKQDTSMLKKNDSRRHTYENDKQKFNLYLKLLFAMGVNWSMEIISWAVIWRIGQAPAYIWYLTDFCNAIYGVFIFFIFVFKKSIWLMLKKRYYSFIGKPYLGHSMTKNQTRTTNSSSVNPSLHGTNTTELLTTVT